MTEDKIKVFALGGLDENGKNMYIVEINNDIFVFDCGLKYPTNAIPGVDALIPNYDYLKENKSRVRAYIISHGHDSNMGALPFIYKDVPAPVVTSPFTARLIEIHTEQVGLKIKYQFDYIEKSGAKMISGHKFHFVQVTHSVPYSYGFSVFTSQGLITYTGDYVIDFNNLPEEFKLDIDALQDLQSKKILLMMADSTNANLPDHACPDYLITNKIEDVFENSTGRIFAAIYGQNIIGMTELLSLASKYNKTVIFAHQEAADQFSRVMKDISFHGYSTSNPVKFEKFENINRIRDKDTLVLLINEGSTLFRNIITFVNGGFSSQHIEFTPEDTFILDCPSVPANEILGTQALDETYKTGCKIIHFTRKNVQSMHACEEDIKTILKFFKPQYYFPVNGSYTKMMANAKIALGNDKHYNYSNIFVLDNGMVINAENGICKVDYKNVLPTGDVLIDGTDIGNIGNNVIEERNKMSKDGVVIMGITVSGKSQQIIGGPDVQMRGFVFLKESENILHNITDLFLDQVRIYLTGYRDNVSFEDKIIDRVSRYIFKETGKHPVIIPAIVDIDA